MHAYTHVRAHLRAKTHILALCVTKYNYLINKDNFIALCNANEIPLPNSNNSF